MVLIYTMPGNEESAQLRRTLLREKIPCALSGPGQDFASTAKRVPLVMITEDASRFAEGFRRSIPIRKLFSCAPDHSIVMAVYEAYQAASGTSMERMRAPHVRIVDGIVYCHASQLFLTPNEQRILTLLLSAQGHYFTADEVAAYCLKVGGGNAVAVHVCHINEKSYECCHIHVIECKRYRGYRVARTVELGR